VYNSVDEIIFVIVIQVSKEFRRAVNVLRSSVQLLVLPPTLSPAGLEGMVSSSVLEMLRVSQAYGECHEMEIRNRLRNAAGNSHKISPAYGKQKQPGFCSPPSCSSKTIDFIFLPT
jgi:hypothetical protein